MSEFVHNCPRCKAEKITFDVVGDNKLKLVDSVHGHQDRSLWEAFSVCRRCGESTVFVLKTANDQAEKTVRRDKNLTEFPEVLNKWFDYRGYINIKHIGSREPPLYLPEHILASFTEAATCASVQCFNAAGAMYRLCIDLATKDLLPEDDSPKASGAQATPNAHERKNLGPRLAWLFQNNGLPPELRELAECITYDGNDGAHDGSLTNDEAEDLGDFAFALLERLYTEPKKLQLASARRTARREARNNA